MIFAKIKGNKKNPPEHRILFPNPDSSDKFNFYLPPPISQSTKYNPEKKLESNEWFYVELSQAQVESMIMPYLSNASSSADLNKSIQSDYSVIEVVYRVIDQQVIFTKITESFKIRNRLLLKFHDTEEAELVREEHSIEFTGKKDAYFNGSNKLYFKDFGKIKSLFPGIEIFFREATHEEKTAFLENDLFDVENIDPDKIGQRDSSRIAVVLNDSSIGLTDGSNKGKILKAAREYSDLGIEINENDKLIIKDNSDLKQVLDLVTSRYYTSEITGQKMKSYGSTKIESSESQSPPNQRIQANNLIESIA